LKYHTRKSYLKKIASQSKSDILVLIVITIVSAAFFYVTTNFGLFTTHDSGIYLNAARFLSSNNELIDVWNNSLILYPPLYPLFLTIGKITGVTYGMHFLVFIINCFLVWKFCGQIFVTKLFKTLSIIAVITTLPFFLVHLFYWSEGVYILLSLCFLLSSLHYLKKQTFKTLLLLAFITALMPLQRLVGVSLICYASIFVFLVSDKTTRIKKGIFVFLASSSAILLWIIRNIILTGRAFENYQSNTGGFLLSQLYTPLEFLSTYFVPLTFSFSIKIGIVIGVFVLILLVNKTQHILLLTSYVLFYVLFIIFVDVFKDVGTTNLDNIERYLSVVSPMVMILVFLSLENIQKTTLKFKPQIIALLFILWFIYPSYRMYKNVKMWHGHGAGYSTSYWIDSKVIVWLNNIEPDKVVLSDNPTLIASLTNHKSIYLSNNQGVESKYIVLFNQEDIKHKNLYRKIEFPKANVFMKYE